MAASMVFAASVSAEAEFGWKGSTFVRDKDKGYEIKFGGRLMNDWSINDADAALGTVEDGTRFRRARLYSSGTVYHNVIYKFQLDFAGGDSDFKDVYVGLKKLPLVSTVKAGHQYEPAGLETVTSSKYITFIERSVVSALMPERKTGLAMFRAWDQDKATLGAGVFQASNSYGDAKGNDYAYTGRVTAAPINEDKGRKLVHLGASASFRKTDGTFSESIKPSSVLAPTFLKSGDLMADEYILFGGEAAGAWGAFSLQAEMAVAQVKDAMAADSTALGDPKIQTVYVQGSYFLTGEQRGYKKGAHSGVKVAKPFDGKGSGIGAWEVAARFAKADMNDGTFMQGEFTEFTAALNWYINTNAKVMLNFVSADLDTVGKLNSFGTRFQIFF